MSNYAIFGGAGYFTGATLGNLLTINKLRIVSKNVKLTTSGYLWTQADNTQREFGILHQQSLGIKYNYGSSTAQTLLTTAEMTAIFGTYEPSVASFGVEFDLVANTFEVFVNGVSRKGPSPLIKGSGRLDGTLFRIGARSNTGIAGDTSGTAILPSGCWVGDTDVYINDVLVRRYVMPSAGTTVPELISGAILTQRGTWPGDDSEWGNIIDPQSFAVSQSTIRPGNTISGTYTAWPTTPTASLVLTDTNSNTLTLTPTVVGSSGDGTWSATIPELSVAGSDVELLKFGATTVSFAGFTAKAGPALTVATTQTLATLASGFDNYVFQGWLPQPVDGDQLVTVTADGVFNSNGDYTFYAEGVYPVWYIDGTGQVYGRTIDTSGLNDVVATPTITPGSGTYSAPVTVTITTATDGATLRYTTNGTDVTSGSTLYSAPFNVATSATVKARGFKDGLSDSEQSSQTYVVNTPGPVSDIDELSVWQAEYTHALRINQIIDATGINVVKVSVQQQEYIYALKVNEIITALGLPIKLLSVQQQSFMTALTINQIISAIEAVVYGLNFNKSSIYGTLANRVIDVTGDIEIEFYTPDYIGTAGFSQSIVAQCAASTFTAQEFELYFSGGSGNIVVNIGGTLTTVASSGQFTASSQYRLLISGASFTLFNMAGGTVRTGSITRGAAREPAAAVTIGARFNGTSMVEYFGGVQRDLKINGVLWPMSSRDQAVQPSTPTGNSMTITGATSGDWVLVS